MWKCPGCDEDYGGWGDKAPCVIPECDHMMCRDCCEKRGRCMLTPNLQTCKLYGYVSIRLSRRTGLWSPPCTCVCGAVKYFQPDHKALRLLEEAKEMKALLAQPLSVKTASDWMRTNVCKGDPESLTVFVKTLQGGTLELKNLYSCDTIGRLKLMIHNCEGEGYTPGEQRLIFTGKQLQDDLTLSHYKIEDGSIIHVVLRLRGC